MQRIHDCFASAGRFLKENRLGGRGSPLKTGQLMRKIIDHRRIIKKNASEVMNNFRNAKKTMIFSHELAGF